MRHKHTNEDFLPHGKKPVNPLRGMFASVSAGGTKIYLSKASREAAGIGWQVVLAFNSVEDILNFYPPIPRSRVQPFSIRTGYVTTVVLARVLGYVPHTTFLPVHVEEGRISMSLTPLRAEIRQLSIA